MFNPFKKIKDEPLKEQLEEFSKNAEMIEKKLGQKVNIQEACDEIPNSTGEFGHSKTNPIPVNGIKGEIKYLNRLRCTCGVGIIFHRIGSLTVSKIKDEVDIFETVCLNGTHWDVLYLHMYHPRRSTITPKGYTFSKYHPLYSKNILAFGSHTKINNFPFGIADELIKNWGSELGKKMADNLNRELRDASKFIRPPDQENKLKNLFSTKGNQIEVTTKEFAQILLDSLKTISEHFYNSFSQHAQNILDIKLDEEKSILLMREIYIINLWIISKILSLDKNILDELHKIYLLPHNNQEQINQWLANKNAEELKNILKQDEHDLLKRYKQYYENWNENSGDQSALTLVMIENMLNEGKPDKRFVRADLNAEVNVHILNALAAIMELREKFIVTD